MICSQCGCNNPPYMQYCLQCASEFPQARGGQAPAQRSGPPMRPAPAPMIEDARKQRVYEPVAARVVMPMDPKPYDYRLPYRPPRNDARVSQYAQPRPAPRALETYSMPAQQTYYAGMTRQPQHAQPMQPQLMQQGAQPAMQQGQQNAQQPLMQQGQLTMQQSQQVQQGARSMRAGMQSTTQPAMQQGAAQGAAQHNMMQPQLASMPSRNAAYPPLAQLQPEYNGWYPPEAQGAQRQAEPPEGAFQPKAGDESFDFDGQAPASKRSSLRIVVIAAIAVLLAAVVYFGFRYVTDTNGGIATFLSTLGLSAQPTPTPSLSAYDVVAEAITHEGKSAHNLVYSGTEGERIRLDDLDKEIERNGSKITFIIVDSMLLPKEPDPEQAQVDVYINATLLDKDGVEIRKLKVQPLVVEVPKIEITLTSPASLNEVIDAPQVDIAGSLSVKGNLMVNDIDISQGVSADGAFTYTLPLPGYGEHTVKITASLDRYRSETLVLNLDYPKKEVNIVFADGITTRTLKTTSDVSGIVEPGAEVKLDGETDGELKYDSETGAFSFTAKLAQIGLNTFTITATKDGIETQKSISIERTPDVDEYSRQAQSMDYAALAKSADGKLKGRIYVCLGKITSITQSDPYHVFVYNVGSDDKEQLIAMEFYGTMQLEEGVSYRIYGDVAGMDEVTGLPKIIARFVYTR